jgi:cytochrome c oxidase cbb3-type subunit III
MQQSLKIAAVALFVLLAGAKAFAQEDAKAAAGAEVYATNCASCHGERLANSGGMPDLRKLGPGDRAKFVSVVSDGKGQMPPWAGTLSDEEIDQIWAYIRSKAGN